MRPDTRLRLLVGVPRRIRIRESWVFIFKTRSLPMAWAHGTALALPMDGRETPVRRRAACPGKGGRRPGWSPGPRPRSLTREARPCVDGSEAEIGIGSGFVKAPGWGDSASDSSPSAGPRAEAHDFATRRRRDRSSQPAATRACRVNRVALLSISPTTELRSDLCRWTADIHSRDSVSAILNVAPPPGVSSTQMRPP